MSAKGQELPNRLLGLVRCTWSSVPIAVIAPRPWPAPPSTTNFHTWSALASWGVILLPHNEVHHLVAEILCIAQGAFIGCYNIHDGCVGVVATAGRAREGRRLQYQYE